MAQDIAAIHRERAEIDPTTGRRRTLAAIGKARGITRERVRQLLTLPANWKPRPRCRPRYEVDADAVAALYTLGCRKVDEIAAFIGHSCSPVLRVLRERGIATSSPKRRAEAALGIRRRYSTALTASHAQAVTRPKSH